MNLHGSREGSSRSDDRNGWLVGELCSHPIMLVLVTSSSDLFNAVAFSLVFVVGLLSCRSAIRRARADGEKPLEHFDRVDQGLGNPSDIRGANERKNGENG